jgi:mono/diheme cytochrome c family protein
MMKTLVVTSTAVLAAVLALSGQTKQGTTAKNAIATPVAERAVLTEYCETCHQGASAPMGFQIDKLDLEHVDKDAEKWEKVVRKVRAGMMPPAGNPRPDAATYEAMTVYLESELDKHRIATMPPPGLHRLNRTEYSNAIRDLLAVDVDPAKYLPSDDSTRGFDNIAGALTLSPALLEGYTSAAGKISRLAVGDVVATGDTAAMQVP